MRVVTEGGVGLADGAKVEVGHAAKGGEKGKGEKKKGAKDEDDKAKDGEK
jgi:hypothetical protein